MRITLFICGLLVGFLAILTDVQGRAESETGYFLLAGATILASALWRSDGLDQNRCRAMRHVYSALAAGPLDMDSLMKQVVEDSGGGDLREYYEAIVGRMLAKRQLVLREGLVTIGDGVDDKA